MANRRILILDDDPDVAQTIQWIAESLGFEAEFVTRAEDFFYKLKTSYPDVITIDLVMPELDGVEIMRLLAERQCSARIIISSGMDARVLAAAQQSAAEHGLSIAGVLPKPISRESLRALIGAGAMPDEPASLPTQAACCQPLAISESDLRKALEHHEFVLVYQPKIECCTGAPAGFEALVRWKHPVDGIIPPDRFILLAEDTGLIDPLTQQIFEQSLAWFSQAFRDSPLKLSLNISAKSLVDMQMVDRLFELCHRYGIAPERVVLELTETSAMVDPTLSLDLMTRFRVKGFQLSLDDFGTGFSSMVQLVRLPFSEIKVDKSFVMQARHSQEAQSIIKSVIDLGHSLSLLVTAEGVENRETFEYIRGLGCDLAQGYWIAAPMPGDAAPNWISQRK